MALARWRLVELPIATQPLCCLAPGDLHARVMAAAEACDVFLSHCWLGDEEDEASTAYSGHEKVVRIKQALVRRGLRPWLDEERLGGASDLMTAMSAAIDSAPVFLAMLTQRYIKKVRPGAGKPPQSPAPIQQHHTLRVLPLFRPPSPSPARLRSSRGPAPTPVMPNSATQPAAKPRR